MPRPGRPSPRAGSSAGRRTGWPSGSSAERQARSGAPDAHPTATTRACVRAATIDPVSTTPLDTIRASAADLPAAVAAALADPPPGEDGVLGVGDGWPTTSWGRAADPPLLLVHGVTSNALIWWRIGPALAAAGYRVTAIDMPGHGRQPRTDAWSTRFADTAQELAKFIRAAGLTGPEAREGAITAPALSVVGHSWGAMVTAHLPAAGLAPGRLVLIDPPVLTHARMVALTEQPTERTYDTLEAATTAVRLANPEWTDGDIAAKARALTEFNPDLVLAVLRGNGDWDGGMAALRHPNAAAASAWLIRGEWSMGGFIPEAKVPKIAAQLGRDHVITIAGAPHSPQRTHPEATVLALLRALA
ncbi:MAG: alpha/beta fold hydrolase [Chloroflexota bacterium]|nr:MAG: alpha/beta fold hydrolase [Chloroflexota bacterium]